MPRGQQAAASKQVAAGCQQEHPDTCTHVGNSIPDPFLLDVLNRLVSVQDLEDDLAFQVLEGIQADFPGHSFCRA